MGNPLGDLWGVILPVSLAAWKQFFPAAVPGSFALVSDSMSRNPALALLMLTVVLLGALMALGVRLPIGLDETVRRDVRSHVASEDIDRRIVAALKAGDIARARSYGDLSTFMGWHVAPSLKNKLGGVDRSQNGSTDSDVVAATQTFGSKTQAITEITGKHSAAEFATSLGVFDFAVEHIVGLVAWLLALFGLAVGRRVVPLLRA